MISHVLTTIIPVYIVFVRTGTIMDTILLTEKKILLHTIM